MRYFRVYFTEPQRLTYQNAIPMSLNTAKYIQRELVRSRPVITDFLLPSPTNALEPSLLQTQSRT